MFNRFRNCIRRNKVFVELFGVILAGGAFWYTIKLFNEASEQTGAAIKSANSAEDQIEISRDIANKQLRAYLVVEEPQLSYPHSPSIGNRIEMTFIIRNDGQTPAYETRDSLYLEIRSPKNRPIVMPVGTRDFNHPIYGSDVQHRRTVHSGKQIVTKAHANGFKNGEFRIFFWGRIEYTDIFEESHWTTFCYEYIFEWDEFRPYGKCHKGDKQKISQRELIAEQSHTTKRIETGTKEETPPLVGIITNDDPWYIKHGVPTIFTLLVGAITFIGTQLWFRRKDKKQKEDDYCSLLLVTAEEVKRNLDNECQMHAYFYVGIVPTFDLSFHVSDNVFQQLTKICQNYDLLKQLYQKYFEYAHIQNRILRTRVIQDKIKAHLLSSVSPTRQGIAEFQIESLETGELIRGNIQGSWSLYNSIVEELQRFPKQEKLEPLARNYLDDKFEYFQKETDVVAIAQRKGIDLKHRKKYYE